ncbi:hypothetical protein M408DRAFT_24741 [Serendipita vermifera MAFF 305830]|uniref:Uncharacterized protein n=1 Tax=Serendipita vermifera MAFF 305830 TaxID=933852 RepID=A0A0C2WLS3_SERVB|nr:hypothetical protein M408DRAFT_24741 [Serendipita vermifera MAFF 305830]
MPMTASTIRQHQQTSSTSSSSQYPPEKATYNRLTAAAAAAIPSSPPPSFLDIDAHSPPPSGAPATSYRNPAMAGGSSTAAAMVAAAQRNNAIQQAKNMKGPRPRDGSSPPPTAQGGRQLPTTPVPAPADNGRGAGTRVEDWNRLGGVRLTGSSTSLSNRRNPTDFPESPIDPAVQWS